MLRTASHDNAHEERLGVYEDRHFLHTESICTIPKPFNTEKLSNSSDLMEGKSNYVNDADFSSQL